MSAVAVCWLALGFAIAVACYATGSAWPLLAFVFAPSYSRTKED